MFDGRVELSIDSTTTEGANGFSTVFPPYNHSSSSSPPVNSAESKWIRSLMVQLFVDWFYLFGEIWILFECE